MIRQQSSDNIDESRSPLCSDNDQATILKARAMALAKKPESAEEDGACLEVVEFLLAHERYALELSSIREVYPLKGLTKLPGLPPFVLGITNVRGQILSVIDLKKFFDLPGQELTELNRLIILSSREMEFAILADRILGTRSMPIKNIHGATPTLTGVREKYLKGITQDSVVILDGNKILTDESIILD